MSGSDDVKARLTPEGKFALLIILCGLLVFAVAISFDQPELGLGGCMSFAMFAIAIRATWRLHRHRWYWFAVALSALLQVPFVLYVPWTNHAYRGTALLPFGALDFIVVWGCIRLTEKALERNGR